MEVNWRPTLGSKIDYRAGLMHAIETNSTPSADGADNLNTLRAVHASYLSHAEQRSVQLTEIQG